SGIWESSRPKHAHCGRGAHTHTHTQTHTQTDTHTHTHTHTQTHRDTHTCIYRVLRQRLSTEIVVSSLGCARLFVCFLFVCLFVLSVCVCVSDGVCVCVRV